MIAYRGDPSIFHFFDRLQDFFKNTGLKINLLHQNYGFLSVLCPLYWENPALISEITQAFWTDVKGGAGSYPGWHHMLCGHAGIWLFMNYFLDMLELSVLRIKHTETLKNWTDASVLKPTNMSWFGNF